MQLACTTAAFGTVLQVADFLSELAEIQRPDFFRTWLYYRRLTHSQSALPAHQRRVAQPKLTRKAAVGQAICFFNSVIMASAFSMRSFFFRPLHAGIQFQVRQHIL